jgi:predicted metal-dependent hydrolase
MNNETLHETTLEHALDVAKANHKEAARLLEDARAAYKAGDIGEGRVRQLEDLLAVAAEDLRRVTREQ